RGLPVAALEQDEAVTLALVRAGLRSLGDLADRPSPVLAARFGEGVTTALRRITGREDIRVTPLRPPPVIMAERHFQEPFAELDGLLAVLERLAGDVTAALEARGAGGRAFEAAFFRADGAVRHLVVETAGPTRDAAALMRLIRLRIEALADPLDPGFGFDALRLVVLRGEALEVAQPDLAGGRDAREEARALAGLVDRLVARFGRETVRRFVARDSHDPVRAGGTVPWLEETDDAPWPEPEPGQPPARPLTLFGRPQPIDVLAEVPDSPPLRFRWRRVLHEVARAEGPERIAPEWWRAQDGTPPPTRDYYRVEDAAGHRFWIFREGLYEEEGTPPRWFVHGLFA
ncbi:DNA polymerase Y family protein, partial [Oharaeibacter diazotrophicus]